LCGGGCWSLIGWLPIRAEVIHFDLHPVGCS
jgi:hypothetical protein